MKTYLINDTNLTKLAIILKSSTSFEGTNQPTHHTLTVRPYNSTVRPEIWQGPKGVNGADSEGIAELFRVASILLNIGNDLEAIKSFLHNLEEEGWVNDAR